MMEWFERLKRSFKQPMAKGTRFRFGPKLLLLLCLGIGLISFNSLFSGGGNKVATVEPANPVTGVDFPGGRQLLQDLTVMLEQIRGVNNVELIITLESSTRQELVVDLEESRRQTVEGDGSGGRREITEETTRETHVLLRDAQGREIPLVIQENQPRYRGAIVVADGVDSPQVKAQVVEALRSILDLPYHRITVLPRGE
ncbi:MAG: hypothetical protein AB1767_11355 [Bacillota bacterium]